MTNQRQIREAFWASHPEANRRMITDFSGKHKMYVTDTRCAFVDFLDNLHQDGVISDELAQRATL